MKHSDIKPVQHITANSEITLPPRTETTVFGALTEDKTSITDYLNNQILTIVLEEYWWLLHSSTFLRYVIPVRVANISHTAKVIKEGEVLATCTPVTCINRNFQDTLSESSDILISELLQNTEFR
ncbi:hypothetical protein NPIL_406881 [Nephila pilipes]|uniref:Uncharacterized protein n=1 Tax=Nephila pilipes TaxID=299642 RepID=A0A8X6QVZ5_NEPPI|nr:hypothetical protein NPIL_406881 [Nephila pilipes]